MKLIYSSWLCLALLLTSAWAADQPIVPSVDLPSTTPWDLKALSAAPKFEWVDDKSPIRSLLYAGPMYQGKPTRVFAYYASPGTLAGNLSLDKNLPAMVLAHGGGGTAFREWVELWARRGYAAIAMDLAGRQPFPDRSKVNNRLATERLPDGGPDQESDNKFGHMNEPVTEHWLYHAVANVIGAHSLIRSMPGVDSDRTALTGISWGGFLTSMIAGIDTRFKAAVPVYGCGFMHEALWADSLKKYPKDQQEKWIQLYDPSRYLPCSKMPMLWVNGTNDKHFWLPSYHKSYSLAKGPQTFRITVNMPHGHPPGWAPPEIGAFIDDRLNTQPSIPLPTLSPVQLSDGILKIDVTAIKNDESQIKAQLHYTSEGLSADNEKRKWAALDLQIAASGKGIWSYSCTAPLPAAAKIWFVTITNAHNMTLSSELHFADPTEPN